MSTAQSRRLGMGPIGVSGTSHTDWDSIANGADQSFFIPRNSGVDSVAMGVTFQLRRVGMGSLHGASTLQPHQLHPCHYYHHSCVQDHTG